MATKTRPTTSKTRIHKPQNQTDKQHRAERAIVEHLIAAVLDAGYDVRVEADCDKVVPRCDQQPRIISGMFDERGEPKHEEVTLHLYRETSSKPVETVWLLFGWEGWNVIEDHSVVIESVITPTLELADRLLDECYA